MRVIRGAVEFGNSAETRLAVLRLREAGDWSSKATCPEAPRCLLPRSFAPSPVHLPANSGRAPAFSFRGKRGFSTLSALADSSTLPQLRAAIRCACDQNFPE